MVTETRKATAGAGIAAAMDDVDTLDDPSIRNKYTPARPNDYEQYCLEREQKKKDEETRRRNAELEAEMRKRPRGLNNT